MNDRIELVINGTRKELERVATLTDVLERLSLDPRTVVVELNQTIVRRANLSQTTISNGDHLEIVHFVGGG